MRAMLVAIMVWAAVLPTAEVLADCGVAPVTPVAPPGCRDLRPRCVCDQSGNCYWEFDCIPYSSSSGSGSGGRDSGSHDFSGHETGSRDRGHRR